MAEFAQGGCGINDGVVRSLSVYAELLESSFQP